MNTKRFSQKDIEEVFKILDISNSDVESYCPVWEVPPLKRGTKISINTKC